MSGSNITIKSNVYVRRRNIAAADSDYLSNVTGTALLGEMKRGGIHLSAVQEKALKESVPCSYSKNTPYQTERAFGLISTADGIHNSCRCENTACREYDFCLQVPYARRIVRKPYVPAEPAKEIRQIEYRNILTRISDGELLFSKPENVIPEEKPAAGARAVENVELAENDFTRIETPDPIVSSAVDEHILVNSGPGTGKTYAIIQRILYLLENRICAPDEIVVLCYTRASRSVVVDRIAQSVREGKLPSDAGNVGVYTFDSYASYFLYEIRDELGVTLDKLDYNGRIRLFTEKIQRSDLDWIKYMIVDEIQDLVNERAEMVLRLIELTDCGLLLCGDRCQAIYDYEADGGSTLDSSDFWRRMNEDIPADTKRYELTAGHRQTERLADISDSMRNVLLNGSISEQNSFAQNDIGKMIPTAGSVRDWIVNSAARVSGQTAILCRSNGEAMRIDSMLCERRIPHRLLRSAASGGAVARWVGDVLWDHCLPELTHSDFIRRYRARVGEEKLSAEEAWENIRTVCETEAQYIEKSRLVSALRTREDLPRAFLSESDGLITISTIHKAKGSEFDNVLIISSDIDVSAENSEEARTRYVAITRAKKSVSFLKIRNRTGWFFRKSAGGRPVQIGRKQYQKSVFCAGVPVGQPEDIDITGCVSADFRKALDIQEYIASRVKKYDPVSVKRRDDGRFAVIHNKTEIGLLSAGFRDELCRCVDATDYRSNIPEELDKLYISDVVTEVFPGYSGDVPEEFRESQIWLGIELTGIGKTVFRRKDNE